MIRYISLIVFLVSPVPVYAFFLSDYGDVPSECADWIPLQTTAGTHRDIMPSNLCDSHYLSMTYTVSIWPYDYNQCGMDYPDGCSLQDFSTCSSPPNIYDYFRVVGSYMSCGFLPRYSTVMRTPVYESSCVGYGTTYLIYWRDRYTISRVSGSCVGRPTCPDCSPNFVPQVRDGYCTCVCPITSCPDGYYFDSSVCDCFPSCSPDDMSISISEIGSGCDDTHKDISCFPDAYHRYANSVHTFSVQGSHISGYRYTLVFLGENQDKNEVVCQGEDPMAIHSLGVLDVFLDHTGYYRLTVVPSHHENQNCNLDPETFPVASITFFHESCPSCYVPIDISFLSSFLDTLSTHFPFSIFSFSSSIFSQLSQISPTPIVFSFPLLGEITLTFPDFAWLRVLVFLSFVFLLVIFFFRRVI